MRKSVMTVLAVLAAAAGFGAITGSITTDQGEQKGTIRWSARDKAYAVKGKNGIEVQVKPSDVVEMSINKPDGYDEAVEQVAKGQGAAAIPALQKIVKDYAHLDWDKAAGRYLAEALIVSGKAADGLRVCEDIIKNDETAAYKGDLAPSYWEALLVLDRRQKLDSSLQKAAKSGDPFSVGAALIKRGDIILKEGKDSNDAATKALVDGYLRVVLMYRDPEIAPKLQPEALYKACKCFEKLGQSGRAESMRAQLKQYADSPWAAK